MLPLKICSFDTVPKCFEFQEDRLLMFFEWTSNSESRTMLNGMQYFKASPGDFQTPSHF